MQKSSLALVLSTSLVTGFACSSGGGDPPAQTGGTSGSAGGSSGGGGGSTGSGGGASGGRSGSGGGGGGATSTGGSSGATGGTTGQGGATSSGGSSGADAGSGGRTGSDGGAGASGDAGRDTTTAPDAVSSGDGGAGSPLFSFFYTSLDGMRRLSKSQNGFGGDLRFGEATGLAGADKICQTLAADVGAGNKTWRAYLSIVNGPGGQPVHAHTRIGEGPWYDRRGRLIAMNKAGLFGTFNRPMGDPAAVNDLPDETGQGTRRLGDTHDVITGSNQRGELRYPGNMANTCNDWTSASIRATVGMGHAWPAGSGMHWSQVHTEPSCVAGVNLVQNGPGNGSSIGAGGGWGGIYCFALSQ
ncbi:MAG TPA: hypothetical protein VGG33_04220 [Polyangia bacterium]